MRPNVIAVRYCNQDTFNELMRGGHAEEEAGFEGRIAYTYSAIRDGFTEWFVVADGDTRLNTVEKRNT